MNDSVNESAVLPTRKLATIEVRPCPTCFAAIPLHCVEAHVEWHIGRTERGLDYKKPKIMEVTS